MSQPVCMFCGGRPMSGEHIFAEWIQQYIPRTRNGHESLFQNLSLREDTITTRRHPGDPKSKKIRCVCVRCNNEWMSRIQEAAKPFLVPLFLGQPCQLHRRAQTLIAAWATMFTMVSEHFSRDASMKTIPRDHLTSFVKTQQPPKGWRIWIAPLNYRANGSVNRCTVPIASDSKIPNTAPDGSGIPNTQTTTILIGELAVHALSSEFVEVARGNYPPNRFMTQIWPIRHSPINWPVANARRFSFEAAEAVAEWILAVGKNKVARLRENRPVRPENNP